MTRVSKKWLTAAAAVLVGSYVATPVRQAAAATQPVVNLAAGQTFERDYPALPPIAMPVDFFLGIHPEDCEDGGTYAALCDTIHVKLGATPAQLTDRLTFHSFNFTMTWPGDNLILPTFGNVSLSSYAAVVWDDPVVEDDDGDTECDPEDPIVNYYECFVLGPSGGGQPGGDEPYFPDGGVGIPYFVTSPLNIGLVPKRSTYAIVIFNYYGTPQPYHLKLGYTSITTSKLIDLSQDDVVDLSAPTNETGGGPLGAVPSSSFGLPGSEGFDLGSLSSPVADADLDAASLDADIDGLNRSAADIIRGRNVRRLRPRGDEKPYLVMLWLVGLPVVAGAATAWWFLRRRTSLFGT
ncbi:MAG TPA: hypothetical protein VFB78_12695 [Acidimicrobiales bacterium]|nr:hypothetical protein [Acidimicrobiales bacterium]